MAEGVNRVILIGTLGFDPEQRVTGSGQAVATMRVVTNESYFDKASGQRKETSEWHRVVVWGKTAEMVKRYLKKGRQIFVEGKLRSREWEKDGQKRTTTEVVAQRVVFLGGRGDGPGREDDAPRSGGPAGGRSEWSGGGGGGGAPAEPEGPPDEAFREFSDGGGSGGGEDDVPF